MLDYKRKENAKNVSCFYILLWVICLSIEWSSADYQSASKTRTQSVPEMLIAIDIAENRIIKDCKGFPIMKSATPNFSSCPHAGKSKSWILSCECSIDCSAQPASVPFTVNFLQYVELMLSQFLRNQDTVETNFIK